MKSFGTDLMIDNVSRQVFMWKNRNEKMPTKRWNVILITRVSLEWNIEIEENPLRDEGMILK